MENDNHATVSVDDCRLLTLDRHHHENGNLTVVENGKDFPFEVQRVFYIYDVPGGTDRGGHSHRRCHQFIVADPYDEADYVRDYDEFLNLTANKRK